jgi:hypothetical protein
MHYTFYGSIYTSYLLGYLKIYLNYDTSYYTYTINNSDKDKLYRQLPSLLIFFLLF